MTKSNTLCAAPFNLFILAALVCGLFAAPLAAETDESAPPSATGSSEKIEAVAAPTGLSIVDDAERGQRLFLYSIDHIELDKTSYIFGTNHLPDGRVIELLDYIKPIIHASDRTYMEIDMMEGQAKVKAMTMLPPGTTLKDKLPPETYDELNEFLTSRGLPGTTFDQFKVWAVSSSVLLVDYMSSLKLPLDMQIQFEASFNNVPTEGLETPEEQIAIFESLTDEQSVSMLQQTLKMFKEGQGNPFDEMIDAYLSGDPDELNDYLAKEMAKSENAEMMEAFIARALEGRDETLADRIETALMERPEESHFYAIGAAHLVTDGSVVERLREKGFEVEQVGPVVIAEEVTEKSADVELVAP